MSERGLRSLVVFHIGGVGGPQRSLGGALSWLRARGPVEFMVPERGPTEEEFRALGPVTVAPYTALVYARGLGAGAALVRQQARDLQLFRRELRRRRPDVVVAVTTVLPALLVAARLERVPAVVYAAELYGQEWKAAPLLRAWGWLLARTSAALSRGVVGCSQAVAAQFPAGRGTPVEVAYPPVSPEYADGDRERGRARFGVEDAHPCLAVVGSITRARGQDVALRALAQIRERHPRARLLVVGAPHPRAVDIAFAEELRALAAELGVAGAVTFATPTTSGVGVGAMADIYAAADIVINPARFAEPFGRVAPEALVAGRPVVATRVGAIPEAIRDGVDGLLVAPDGPDALAAATLRLVEDRELAARLVANGRERVLERFGAEQDRAVWARVLEAALPGCYP
jgi:glycosyltransferase involved in cell wall biosynthesis